MGAPPILSVRENTTNIIGEADLVTALNDRSVIDFHGQVFEPTDQTAYVRFRLAFGFPTFTAWGHALHPQVIANSWNSILHTPFNIDHKMVVNGDRQDRMIGMVVAAHFPPSPAGGWKISANAADVPHIDAVAAIAKDAHGADRQIGGHLSGRQRKTVSMEVQYLISQTGGAVKLKEGEDGSAFPETPQDMLASGWGYLPWAEFPKGLTDQIDEQMNFKPRTRDRKRIGNLGGRDVILLEGGLDESVAFKGVGIVSHGAEGAAHIERMLAEHPLDNTISAVTDFAARFLETLEQESKIHEQTNRGADQAAHAA